MKTIRLTEQKPLAIELFAGLFGWGEGLIAEGYETLVFDIVNMFAELGMERRPEFNLVLQDVLTLHGSQFKDADLIVASPPCQSYSYRAMPWKKAKALPPPDNSLFEACFRIQREACEAAGRHIPLIVENVRGAQKWVGRSRWNFGSFHLWGDVPALMPSAKKFKVQGFRFDGSGKSFQTASVNAIKLQEKLAASTEGVKQAGISGMRNNGKGDRWFQDGAAQSGSKSKARKAASAAIAKIPLPLSQYIARTFKP